MAFQEGSFDTTVCLKTLGLYFHQLIHTTQGGCAFGFQHPGRPFVHAGSLPTTNNPIKITFILKALPGFSFPSHFFPWLLADLRASTCIPGDSRSSSSSPFHIFLVEKDQNYSTSPKSHVIPNQRTPLGISSDDVELAEFLLDQVLPLCLQLFFQVWSPPKTSPCIQYTGRGRNISLEDLGNLTNLFTDAWFTYGIDRWSLHWLRRWC